jgi:hypothetical protein
MINKGEFFAGTDRYLSYPHEDALFFWDYRARKIRMKFTGQDYDVEVPQDHRLFNEAILSGSEITRAEYEAGSPVA